VVQEAGGASAPQKFCFIENLDKIPENLGKTSGNLGKMPENPDKNGAQHLQKNTIKTFFWRSHQKQVFMLVVGENVWAKGAQKLFGKVWGNSGKNPVHPQKFARSFTYDLDSKSGFSLS